MFEKIVSLINCLTPYVEWISLLISIIIAIVVYLLSNKITFRNKLEHRTSIRRKVEVLLNKIESRDLVRKVKIINTAKYNNRYFEEDWKKRIGAYSYLYDEIKTTKFDGIEFFIGEWQPAYKRNGKLHFTGTEQQRVFNVITIGLIPYENIKYFEEHGDERDGYPEFYTKFNGNRSIKMWPFIFLRYPYSETRYYKINENYQAHDPIDWKYERIHDKIYK